MEITCLQMDVLLSFYIEGELSSSLKEKVEEHLEHCQTCRAKYNIVSSLFSELKNNENNKVKELNEFSTNTYPSLHYKEFKDNLSAYMDNELPPNETIKIKKMTISNKKARKELEDSYHIRRLMKNSFKKTDDDLKEDFSKKVLKQLEINNSIDKYHFNPLIKVSLAFIITIMLLAVIILLSVSFG